MLTFSAPMYNGETGQQLCTIAGSSRLFRRDTYGFNLSSLMKI